MSTNFFVESKWYLCTVDVAEIERASAAKRVLKISDTKTVSV